MHRHHVFSVIKVSKLVSLAFIVQTLLSLKLDGVVCQTSKSIIIYV